MSIDNKNEIKNPRVRMAPSPTGFFHIGSGRTALFNYLFAKKYGGTFVLRIEDTDKKRTKKEFEEDIFESMQWLGIDADEDPARGGPCGPYRQSERTEIYKKYLQQLLDARSAFYCFHTEAELEDERKKQMDAKKNPIHSCEYRAMPQDENKKRASETGAYVIRFKTPLQKILFVDDLIRGKVSFDTNLIGDFSIAKKIDEPLYNFAVAIDDALMHITHIIRGEEHISNTPRQILIQEALGLPPVSYAHLPLILATDRSKLSKRHGAASVRDYRDAGYLPEALVNFIALLGWNPGGDREIFSKAELEKEFSIERVQKSGAVFDSVKLDWMNGEYIRQKSEKELFMLSIPFLEKAGLIKIQNAKIKNLRLGRIRLWRKNYNSKFQTEEYIYRVLALEQPRLKKLSEIGERVEFFFREPTYDKELLRWKNMTDSEVKNSLQKTEKLLSEIQTPADKKTLEKAFFGEIGDSDKGMLLWPLRAALSGKKASPGPFEIIEILGIPESLNRLKQAEQKFS